MVKIPRAEQQAGFRSVDMPMSSGDGYQAPGKATEALGKSIMGLGPALAGLGEAFNAEQDKNDAFKDQLTALQFKNEWDLDEIKSKEEYQGDGTGYAAARAQRYQELTQQYLPKLSPKGQQRFSLQAEAWRGASNESNLRFEYGRKEQTLFTGTSAMINGEASKLTQRYGPAAWQQQAADGTIVPPKMEEVEAAVLEVARGQEAMINQFPNPGKREQLRQQAADALFKFLQGVPAEYRGQITMRMMQQLEAMQPPGQPPSPASNIGGEMQRWGGASGQGQMKTFFPVGGSMSGKTWDDVPRSGGSPNSREWGGPRAGGRHAGIDIPGRTGDPVFAASGGTVLSVTEGQGYGKMVDVRFPDGTVHRFAHLAAAAPLRPGQQIPPGAEIGKLGYSGNAGPEFPHVHLEVFKNEQAYRAAAGQSSRASWNMRINPREYYSSLGVPAGAAVAEPVAGNARMPSPGPEATPELTQRITPQQFFGDKVDASKLPLGMRISNNPTNIKYSGSNWQRQNMPGLVGPSEAKDEGDPQAQFANPLAGMVAGARLALLKNQEQGLDTIEKIITDRSRGWTPGYKGAADHIAKLMGVSPTDKIDLSKPATMQRFMRALITQEHGEAGRLYGDDLIAKGVQIAVAGVAPGAVAQRGLPRFAGLPSQTMTDAGPQPAGNDNTRAPNTIPAAEGQPQQVAQAQPQGSNVVPMARQPVTGQRTTGSYLAEKLREHVPQLMAAEQKAVAGLVKQVEDAAGEGFAHARLPEIEGKVKQIGNPQLTAQLEAAKQALAITVNLRKAPPAVITNVANEMRAQMAGKATPDQLAKLDIVEKLATNSAKALRDDPITWAFKANVVPEPGLLVPDAVLGALGKAQSEGERKAIEGAAVEGLKERLALAQGVQAQYGSEFKFFTEPERAKWGELVKGGGPALMAALGVIGQLGPENAARIINEVEDGVQTSKEMRAGAGHAAWLLAHNVNTQAAKDIVTAIQMRSDPQYKGQKLDRTQIMTKFNEAMGTALYAFPPTERDALMNAADAVFEVRNKAGTWDGKSADVYKGIVKELIGERTKNGVTYGGIIGNPWIGKNRPEIIPPNVSQNAWGSLLESITAQDLKEAGHVIPVFNNGEPVPLTKAMNGRLVNVGDGRYMISLGDPNVRGGEKWVMAGPAPVANTPADAVKTGKTPAMPEGSASTTQTAPQREFVLDWKKIEPILRRRRPDAFY